MTKYQMFTRRRVMMAGAAVVGAAGAAGVASLLTGDPGTGSAPASGASPAAGPQAHRGARASAYRLQPIAGYSPARLRTGTLVRREPLLRVYGIGRSMVLTFDDGPDPRYTPDIL